MLDRLSVLWMKMPAIDTINPQSNKFVTYYVKIKTTDDSKLNV